MEYKLSTASSWTNITSTEINGLAPGTYEVRVKANGTTLASPAATVTIGAHTCAAQGEWQYDENEHWKLCRCGEKVDAVPHSGGTATCTEKAQCQVCGQSYGSVDPENHTGAVVWSQTATTHKEVYNCCNAEASPETAHTWENGECSVCGYVCRHTGGEANCEKQAVCDICGAEYGGKDAYNHTKILVRIEEKPATHLAAGNTAYWYCGGCGNYFSDQAGTKLITLESTEIPELPDHIADGTGWHFDGNSHWNGCLCGAVFNESTHTFAWVTDKEATVIQAGEKHEECTVCGYAKAAVEIPATGTGALSGGNQSGGTNAPQTGDDSNPVLNVVLLMIAGAGLTVTAVFQRKRCCKTK